MKKIYSGKVKTVYQTDVEDQVLIEYHDKVTASNGLRKDYPVGKGSICCQISEWFFKYLEKDLLTHYISCPSPNTMLCRKLNVIPVEVICRNIAAGSIVRDIGLKEGMDFNPTLIEYNLKDDSKDDPLLSPDRVKLMGYDPEVLAARARDVNVRLKKIFSSIGLRLVDFKLEFGQSDKGGLYLVDEISPDNMRLWKNDTNESMDKDLFRKNTGDIVSAYEKIFGQLRDCLPRS